jgi:hypothetical protein
MVMPGLYESLDGSDLPQRESHRDQHQPGEDGDPKVLAREGQ